MKKIASVLASLVLVCSLCGCTVTITSYSPGEAEDGHQGPMSFSEKLLAISEAELFYSESVPQAKLAAPAKDASSGSWGYIDLSGSFVIEPRFFYAYNFVNGYAAALDNYNDYQIIDTDGNEVFSAVNKKPITTVSYMSDYLFGVTLETGKAQNKIYVGDDGKTAFSLKDIPTVARYSYDSRDYLALATPFSKDSAVVMRQTNAALFDKYSRSVIFTRGFYHSAYVINGNGMVTAALPAGLDPDERGFDENRLIIVKDMTNEGGGFGLCGEDGKLAAECVYNRILHGTGGLYFCCNSNGFWGAVNKTGDTIINFMYTDALPFSDGYAAVCDGGLWGIINEFGETVIEPMFAGIGAVNPSVTGSSDDGTCAEGLFAVYYDGFWALIDKDLNVISSVKAAAAAAPGEDGQSAPADIPDCPYKYIGEGYFAAAIGDDGLWTVIDGSGAALFAPKFLEIGLLGSAEHSTGN